MQAPDYLKGWGFPDSDFSGKDYEFPGENVDPKSKVTDKYMLRVAQATFSRFVNGRTTLPYALNANNLAAQELQSYAKFGYWTISKYVQQLCPGASFVANQSDRKNPSVSFQKVGDANNSATGKSFMNISWRPVPMIPHFISIAKSLLMKNEYDIGMAALDVRATDDRQLEVESAKLEFDPSWMELKTKLAAMGFPQQEVEQKMKFNSAADVDIYNTLGGFKLSREIDMVALLNASMQESMWDDGAKEMVIEDLLTWGRGATETYVDPAVQVPKSKRLNASMVGGRRSEYNDCRDQDYVFVMERMSLADLRRETEITEVQVDKIVKTYAQFNATQVNYNIQWNKDALGGQSPYNDFGVWVMKGYFISGDIQKYTSITRKKGDTAFNKVGFDYQLSEDSIADGKELSTSRCERVYKYHWVIGTDIVFDFGLANDIAYEEKNGNKQAVLPIRMYNLNASSFVQNAIGFQDDINNDTFKKRDFLAKLPPAPRLLVDKSVAQNIEIGGIVFTPQAMQDLFQESGYYYYESLNEFARPTGSNTSQPIKSLDIDFQDYQLYNTNIEFNINQMRLILGINELVDASTQGTKKAVGVSQLEVAATNNALYGIQVAYESIYWNTLRQCELKWKVLCGRDEGRQIKYYGVNRNTFRRIALRKELADTDYGLYIKLIFGKEQKSMLLQDLIQLKNQRMTTGNGGIKADVYFMLVNQLEYGSLQEVQFLLSIAISKQEQEDSERASANQKQTFDGQVQSAQAATEGEIKVIQTKAMFDDQLATKQSQLDEDAAQRNHERAKELAILNGQIATGNTVIKETGETHRQGMKSATELQTTEIKVENKPEKAPSK